MSLPRWDSQPQESLSSIMITVGVLFLFVSPWGSSLGYSPRSSLAVLLLGVVVWWVVLLRVVVCSGGGMRDTARHTIGGLPLRAGS